MMSKSINPSMFHQLRHLNYNSKLLFEQAHL